MVLTPLKIVNLKNLKILTGSMSLTYFVLISWDLTARLEPTLFQNGLFLTILSSASSNKNSFAPDLRTQRLFYTLDNGGDKCFISVCEVREKAGSS